MKILLDECVPRPIKFSLAVEANECVTVPEAGLAGKTNGELLALAESRFDVFVTLDKGISFQQKLTMRKIAILFIQARSNRVEDVLPSVPACLAALRSIQPGQIVHIAES